MSRKKAEEVEEPEVIEEPVEETDTVEEVEEPTEDAPVEDVTEEPEVIEEPVEETEEPTEEAPKADEKLFYIEGYGNMKGVDEKAAKAKADAVIEHIRRS